MDENHRRIIATTLGLLDQMLYELQELADARPAEAALYERVNLLTAPQRAAIRAEIGAMRQILGQMRDDLRLDMHVEDVGTTIWSRASAFCEYLMELEAKHLRGYGEVPADVAAYVEPKARELTERLRHVVEAAQVRIRR